MKIELGAGDRPAPGFIAVDVNPRSAAVIADAQRLPFRDASVTDLRAVDVLEHVSYRYTEQMLNEWARVCTPDASLYVQVPDALTICEWLVACDDRLLSVPPDLPRTHLMGAAWRLLGGHQDNTYVDDEGDFRWNAHYAMFSRVSLQLALVEAGFVIEHIERNGHPNLCCTARRAA